jgi:LacI family transcriptional regulator
MARDADIAGVLLWYLGGTRNLPALQALRDANIPLVFLDREPPPGFDADYVGIDNEYSAREVVTHLLRLGHRRIAHVSNVDPGSTVAARLSGYRQALEAEGVSYRPELVVAAPFIPPGSSAESHYYADLVDRLLSLPDPPTAIWAVNDCHALCVLGALRARGVRVPEDVALAGFDGIERWLPGPSFLTTACQPFERMGVRAIERLLQRIEFGPAAPYQHVIMDAQLSIHGSTQTADSPVANARQTRNS